MTMVTTTCSLCRTDVTLDFENLSHDEAVERLRKLDKKAMECPGMHVEMGGWYKRWKLDEALRAAYPDHYTNGA
ncbi:hypothetical protein SAMN02799624_05269 [Paenibacillus sp. UNC496MF]|uniref:hypothetical protein n=1 Tax=Paenibacillus sp. UNC496MF TaxID=1502753 RepID=UPI0008F1C719|nr:hypothetical protein [Paenibacillus sp. UNC496MF]SFJ63237.1 hypothetical protein SAMN02799624_05269 [Paenibacillus sp. UNC496MF]